jgi:hypothetical protein
VNHILPGFLSFLERAENCRGCITQYLGVAVSQIARRDQPLALIP